MNKALINKNNLLIIISISFLFFFLKWTLSFYFYSSENLLIKIINDSVMGGFSYFHHFKALSNLEFSSLYNPDLKTEYLLPLPYGAVFIHALLFKLIGIKSVILLELISIFIFLTIFHLIFKKIKFSNTLSLLFAIILFSLPNILFLVDSFGIPEIRTFSENFYNLRFPRPLVANLFYFLFIYLLLSAHYNCDLFKTKNLLLFAFLLGITFSSFFFIFFNQFITLIFYLIFNYKKKIFYIIKSNFIKIFFSLIFFLLIILPFIFLLTNTSDDYMERLGLIRISIEDKVFLLNYYFVILVRLKLLIIYFLFFFHKKKKL